MERVWTSLQIEQGHFSKLRILSASHNALVDIAVVSQLKALVELNVNQNQITDLSPAFQCPLEVLLAAKNRIRNIDGIQQLQRLRRLSLFRTSLQSRISTFCKAVDLWNPWIWALGERSSYIFPSCWSSMVKL